MMIIGLLLNHYFRRERVYLHHVIIHVSPKTLRSAIVHMFYTRRAFFHKTMTNIRYLTL